MKNKAKILSVIGILVVLCVGGFLFFRYQHTSPKRLPDQYGGTIGQIHSASDRDGDGIDDETDILQGALEYISTRPAYKSRYYQTGYPDDGYGVCTDVVANALKSAGYDLMTLIQDDIKANPEDYDMDEPDINIDFRRVQNLKVYFSHTAVSLTTDLSEIEEWQGGDIVVFEYTRHIGVVSDLRDKDGLPFIIHNMGQRQRENDSLTFRKHMSVTDHYRFDASQVPQDVLRPWNG